MKKTSKIATIGQKRNFLKQDDLIDTLNRDSHTQDVADHLVRSANTVDAESAAIQDEHLVVAQAEVTPSDVGNGGLNGSVATPEAATSSAATTGATGAGGEVSAAAATHTTLASTIASTLSGMSAVSYAVIGAGVATVAVVATKKSSTPAAVIDTNAADYLAPNGVASPSIKTGDKVTVSTSASIAQLNALAAAVGTAGSLTWVGVKDTAANLTANSAYIKSGTNVQVTDSATLAQLASFDGLNGTGALLYTSVIDTLANVAANAGSYIKAGIVVNLADTAGNLVPGVAASASISSGQNVTVTDAASIAQLAAIKAVNGAGALVYTAISDTLVNLNASTGASGFVKTATNVTVTDVVSIQQLTALDLLAATVTATNISDTAATLASTTSGAAVTSAYIQAGVNVSVTDAASIAQLAAIDVANGTGTLTYTAGVIDTLANIATNTGGYIIVGGATPTPVAIFDTAANLAPGGIAAAGIATGTAVTVDDATAPAASIAQLTAIDTANTTGTVTYSKIADTLANLTANAGGYIAAGKNLQVLANGGVVNVAALAPLSTSVGATGSVVTDSITDTTANLSQNLKYVTSGTAVTVTDAATIAQLTAIDAANGAGALTYSALQDTVANLTATTTPYLNNNLAVTVTVTDPATIAQLDALAVHPGVTLVASSISDTAANLMPGGVMSAHIVAGVPVTITGAVSLTELAAIDTANGAASVAYSAITDTQANLTANALLAAGAGGYIQAGTNLTVTDVATIAQLSNLDGKNGTAGTVTANAITDTVTNVVAGISYVAAGTAVTLDEVNGPAATVAQLTQIDNANGTGALNYISVSDSAANLAPAGVVTTYIAAGTNVTIVDPSLAAAASIAQLNAIDTANGAGLLTHTGVNDAIANLTAATAAIYLTGGVSVRVTDAASIAQLTTLDGLTGRQTVATSISDTAANLAPANTPVAHITAGVNVTVTDPVTIAELTAIDLANVGGAVTCTTIRDTFANIWPNPSVPSTVSVYVKSGVNIQVLNDGAAADETINQLAALDGLNGSGTVIGFSISDKAANLAPAAVASSYIAPGDAVTPGATVTVTDAASLAQLKAIDTANGALTPVSYTAVADLQAALAANTGGYVKAGIAVTVNDAATIAQLDTLQTTTTIQPIATMIGDTAANLDPNLTATALAHITSTSKVDVTVTDAATNAIGYAELANIAGLLQGNGGGIVSGSSTAATVIDTIAANASNPNISFSAYINLTTGVSHIQHFEKIDLAADAGANTVTLTAADLFMMNSDKLDGAAHVLVVNGTNADSVNIGIGAAAGTFQLQGVANAFDSNGVAGAGYSKYTATYTDATGNHLVEVLLQQGVSSV